MKFEDTMNIERIREITKESKNKLGEAKKGNAWTHYSEKTYRLIMQEVLKFAKKSENEIYFSRVGLIDVYPVINRLKEEGYIVELDNFGIHGNIRIRW